METKDREHYKKHKKVGLVKRQYDKKRKALEEKLGRKLTSKEKDKIFKKALTSAALRVGVVALAVGSLFNMGMKSLPEGNQTGNSDSRPTTSETGAITEENEEEVYIVDNGKCFKDSIKVKSESEKIEEINSVEEVLNWLKDTYTQNYKGGYLDPSQIKIICGTESYLYETGDGKLVTHGETPYVTESQMSNDGQSFEKTAMNQSVYRVELQNGNIIDCATSVDGVFEAVIPGGQYAEIENYNSVLEHLGDITPKAFKLMELYGQLENGGGAQLINSKIVDVKADLVEAMNNLEAQNIIGQQNNNVIGKDGVEPGE